MHLIDIYQLEFIDKKLRMILKDIESNFGPQVITSLYRIDDFGVHGTLPLRAIDLRCRNKQFGNFVSDFINSRWFYDLNRPSKKVAVPHGQGSNYHIHLQVHRLTEKKEMLS